MLIAYGVQMTLLEVERIANGWRLTMRDRDDSTARMDLPDGQPAAIRAALVAWAIRF